VIQLLALFGAFWMAVLSYRGARPLRFVLGLGAAALLAHLGWAVLHWEVVWEVPWARLDPSTGFCVLFAPLGLLLVERSAAAFRALPLAFAVARAGCLAAGCCHGSGGEPTPIYEMGGLVCLHAAMSKIADRRAIPAFCAGFGLVRLGVEPWRAIPPLGEPVISPAWIAGAWVAAGIVVAFAGREGRSGSAPAQNLNPYWNPKKSRPTRGVNELGASAAPGSPR